MTHLCSDRVTHQKRRTLIRKPQVGKPLSSPPKAGRWVRFREQTRVISRECRSFSCVFPVLPAPSLDILVGGVWGVRSRIADRQEGHFFRDMASPGTGTRKQGGCDDESDACGGSHFANPSCPGWTAGRSSLAITHTKAKNVGR